MHKYIAPLFGLLFLILSMSLEAQTIRTRAYLHTRYETGDKPTQTDYRDVFATFFSNLEDSLAIAKLVGVTELSNDATMADSSATALVTESAIKGYVDAGLAAVVASGIADGDKGDIVVSGSGAIWAIDNDVVTLAKQASGTANRLQVFDGAGDPAEGTVAGSASLAAGVLTVRDTSARLIQDSIFVRYVNGVELDRDTVVLAGAGGSVTAGGSNTQIQYNDAGNFAGASGITTDGTDLTLTGKILNSAGTASLPSYSFSGDSNTGIFSSTNDTLAIATAGTERARIDPNGNVGIGTTTPSEKLQVNGEILADSIKTSSGFAFSGSAAKINLSASDLYVQGGTGGEIALQVAGGTAEIGIEDGQVGINTINPEEALDVNGGVRLRNVTTGTNDGTIRYTGTDIEARLSGAWTSLTSGGGADGNGIFSGSNDEATVPTSQTVNLTDSITIDTNTFVINGVANRIGIRENAPAQPLHVSGNSVIDGGFQGINTTSPAAYIDAIANPRNVPYSGEAGGSEFFKYVINNDSLDQQGLGGTKVDGLGVTHNFGDLLATGGRHAIQGALVQVDSTKSTNTDRNYVGVVGKVRTDTGDGGYSGNNKGNYFGGNFIAETTSGSNYLGLVTSAELNTKTFAGNTIQNVEGVAIVSDNDARGTVNDVAIAISRKSTGGVGYKTGIAFDDSHGLSPFDNDSDVISMTARVDETIDNDTVKTFIRATNTEFTEAFLVTDNITLKDNNSSVGSRLVLDNDDNTISTLLGDVGGAPNLRLNGGSPIIDFSDIGDGSQISDARFQYSDGGTDATRGVRFYVGDGAGDAGTLSSVLRVMRGKVQSDTKTYLLDTVGVFTSTPEHTLSLGGEAARSFGVDRRTTSNQSGNQLIVRSGGATSGATNKSGGNLLLYSGTSTGTGGGVGGGSSIVFATPTPGTTGTADNPVTTKMIILNDGKVGIGETSPAEKLQVAGDVLVNDTLKLASYGSGTMTGTATYALAVDANGNVVEEALGGGGGVTGSGTTNYIPKFASSTSLTNSSIYQSNDTTFLASQSVLKLGNGTDAEYPLVVSGNNTSTGIKRVALFQYEPSSIGLSIERPAGSAIMEMRALNPVTRTEAAFSLYTSSYDLFGTANGLTINSGTSGTNDLRLQVNGTELLRVDGNSNGGFLNLLNYGSGARTGTGTYTLATTSAGKIIEIPIDTYKAANGTAALPSYSFTNDTNTGIFSLTNDTLAFSTGGTERAVIDASGRVGIGTGTPTEALEVVGNVEFSGSLEPNADPGAAGEMLVSAGAGSAPTWETLSSGFNATMTVLSSLDTLLNTGADSGWFQKTPSTGGQSVYTISYTFEVGFHETTGGTNVFDIPISVLGIDFDTSEEPLIVGTGSIDPVTATATSVGLKVLSCQADVTGENIEVKVWRPASLGSNNRARVDIVCQSPN